MVNLYQLQLFVAVSERGTFSAAAEQFNMTQPAISQQIRALEDTYKVRLFNRNGPHIELTEAGQRLLEIARPLIEQAQQLEENFSAGLGEVRGRVSLVYSRSTVAGLYLLPQWLAEFHRRYSQVRFALNQATEEAALEMLLDREVNFALLSRTPRQRVLESHLLHSDEIVLVLPPGHPWHNTSVVVAELKNQPVLLRSVGSETRRQTESVLRTGGLTFNDLQIVAEVDSVDSVIQLVRAGLGLSFVSEAIAHGYIKAGWLGCARLVLNEQQIKTGADLKREIYLCRLSSANLSERGPSQERFWEFILTQKVEPPVT